MSLRNLLFILCIFLTAMAALAQKTCDVPMDIVAVEKARNTGGIIRGLKVEDLAATISKSTPLSIESLTYDAAPRRIIFVIDTTHQLPKDARKAEALTAAYILDHARPMDSFALITARGTAREIKFEQGRDAVKQALADLSGDVHEKNSNLGVLDAVEQGLEWLGSPKPGDAIFLLAMDTEGNHKTNAAKIAQQLEKQQVRLFSIAFGFVNLNYNVKSTQTTTSSALATVTRDEGTLVYDNGEQNVYPLTVNSGGLLHTDNAMDEHKAFVLAQQLPQLQKVGMQFYQIMAEFYHMNVNFPEGKAAGWTVELSSKARERWLPVWSVYPRVVNGCGK
jgi:hypothetical protein